MKKITYYSIKTIFIFIFIVGGFTAFFFYLFDFYFESLKSKEELLFIFSSYFLIAFGSFIFILKDVLNDKDISSIKHSFLLLAYLPFLNYSILFYILLNKFINIIKYLNNKIEKKFLNNNL